ncbi:transmembrane protein 209 [Galendromus occidentalis]|uniref:Transmembrane protein 209 n=1 Tax=Galendromus occidentalis TaxID=34638 RepID=A0AAJ6QTZ8_9ACAR|nr:transmembrane protein 209 [Galendromus occidentalis]
MIPADPVPTSPSRSPYREHLQRKQINRQIKLRGPMKAALCLAGAAILYADIYYISLINRIYPLPDFVDYFKSVLSAGLLGLAFGHIGSIAYAHLARDREIEDSCAKLLNISNDDLGFKIKSEPQDKTDAPSPIAQTMSPGSFCLPSAQNSFNESFNASIASTSWQFQSNGANTSYKSSPSYEKLKIVNRYPNSRALDWHIDDEKSADAFLKERSREQSLIGSIHDTFLDTSVSPKRASVLDSGVEAIQRLFTSQPYRAASLTPADEKEKDSKSGSALICRRWNIDEKELFSWNEKLRCWFVDQVFVPLRNEIENINNALLSFGYQKDSLIGEASLSRLHHIASQRCDSLPGFNNVLLYLDLSVNQHYLVNRIHDFCQRAALSSMNWNRGGIGWTDQLPPDAEILMHSFCSYIDAALDPDPEYKDGRQFAHRHLRTQMSESQLEGRDSSEEVLFLHTKKSPPHYLLQLRQDIVDVGSGFNNVLHTIILFLYFHKIKKDSIICGKSMGRRGLDLLKIIS